MIQLSAKEIRSSLMGYQAPRWSDFPAVDLYMDQVVELLNAWLSPLYFDQKKPCLTPNMINNYVKNSIVKAPVKKRYTAAHLAFLYVVMVLKQCFSLQEISALITIYTDMEDGSAIETSFNRFASVFESLLYETLAGSKGCQPDSFFEHPTWQQTLMVDVLQAVCCRLFAIVQIYGFQHPSQNHTKNLPE